MGATFLYLMSRVCASDSAERGVVIMTGGHFDAERGFANVEAGFVMNGALNRHAAEVIHQGFQSELDTDTSLIQLELCWRPPVCTWFWLAPPLLPSASYLTNSQEITYKIKKIIKECAFSITVSYLLVYVYIQTM